MTILFTPRLYHAVLLFLLLFFAIGPPLSAEALAQNAEHVALQEGPEGPVWRATLGQQFALNLQSPILQVREDALSTMIGLAQDKQYNFEAAVPALLSVFTETRHPREQKMAATALVLIGDEASIEALGRLAEEGRDKKLRKHTGHAIALYYLAVYPELAKVFGADKDKRVHVAKVESEIRKIKRGRARALALQTAPVPLM